MSVIGNTRVRKLVLREESSLGEDVTSWDQEIQTGDATPFFSTEPDISSLQQAVVENANTVDHALRRHALLRGLKSDATFSFGTYLHGNPNMAASGSQASHFHLSKLARSAMGGALRSYHYGMETGTSAVPIVEDGGNLTEGMVGFFWDSSASKGYFRQIYGVTDNGGTADLDVRPDLPFTPGSGDVMYAAINCYMDADSLSKRTDAQHKTLAFYFKGDEDEVSFEMRGCKPNMSIGSFTPGELVNATYEVMTADFDNSIAQGDQITGSFEGEAPMVVGADETLVYFGDHSGSVSDPVMFNMEPQVELSHIQVRSVGASLGAVEGYTFDAAGRGTGLNMTLQYSASYAQEFASGTYKQCLVQVDTALSSSFAIFFPRLEYSVDPTYGESAQQHASTLQFLAHRDTLSGSAAGGDAEEALRSPMQLWLVA